MEERTAEMNVRLFKCISLDVVLLLYLPALLVSQPRPDVVIFDEDDAIGVGYYDASYGRKSGGSSLTLGGPGNDKLIISSSQHSTGYNSGLLQWTSVSGGSWRIFVASIGWATRDASGYDSLTLFVNSRHPVAATNLPNIGLENDINISTPDISLAPYLASGTDADTTTWQRVSIPLSEFEPYNGFSLSNFKDVNFSQALVDTITRTMWFDNVRIVGELSIADTALPASPQSPVTRVGDRSVVLHWNANTEKNLLGYYVYRARSATGPFARVTSAPLGSQSFADLDVANGQEYSYVIRALNTNQGEGRDSDTVSASPKAFTNDNDFLD
jgi:hypothetical protein